MYSSVCGKQIRLMIFQPKSTKVEKRCAQNRLGYNHWRSYYAHSPLLC